MNRTKAWLWRQAADKARAIKNKTDVRRAVQEWAVMSRLALGDGVPLRELLDSTSTDVDAIMDARVRGSDGVVVALAETQGIPGTDRTEARNRSGE